MINPKDKEAIVKEVKKLSEYTSMFNDLLEIVEDMDSRIDKANKLIDKNMFLPLDNKGYKELLNKIKVTLKGSE